jgi:hypothetical protein
MLLDIPVASIRTDKRQYIQVKKPGNQSIAGLFLALPACRV